MFKVKYCLALPEERERGVDFKEKIDEASEGLLFLEILISLSAFILFSFSVCCFEAIFLVKRTTKSSNCSSGALPSGESNLLLADSQMKGEFSVINF